MRTRKSKKWLAVLAAMVITATAAFTVSMSNPSNKAEAVVVNQGSYLVTGSGLSSTSMSTTDKALFDSLKDQYGTANFAISEWTFEFQSPAVQAPGSYVTLASNIVALSFSSTGLYFRSSLSSSSYLYYSALSTVNRPTFVFSFLPSDSSTWYSFAWSVNATYRLAVSSGSGDADQIIAESTQTTEFESDVQTSSWYLALQDQSDNLSSQVTSLTTQVTNLSSQVETLTAQVSELETQVTTLTADKTSLQSQVGTLTSEKETLETQLQTALVAYADLEEQYNSLLESQIPVSDYEALLREKRALENQVTALQGNVQTLNARITTLTNQVNTAEQTGYDRGLEEGYDNGYTVGYGKGVTASQGQSLATWDGFFPSLFGSIAGFFVTVLGGTTIFGFSLWQLLLSVLAVIAIVAILKVVIR